MAPRRSKRSQHHRKDSVSGLACRRPLSSTLRTRHVCVHHAIGRIYISACVLGGAAAFAMSFFSSVGLLGFFGFGSLAVIWVLVTLTAYRAIRHRDVAGHQAWMMRSFALTYAAPMLRLWLFALLIPQLILGVPFAAAYTNADAPVPFLCWLPNLVVVELMIRRRRLPALRLGPHPLHRTRQRSPTIRGPQQDEAAGTWPIASLRTAMSSPAWLRSRS